MTHLFVSAFAGGGGASLGAIAAGVQKTIGIEWDPQIAALYQLNVGECIVADVTKFDPSTLQLPTLEERMRTGDRLIWQISPPCTQYSRANTNKNLNCSSATVLEKIYWHETVIQPDFIILENVIDYRSYQGYQGFCDYLRLRQYKVVDYILNAADFGVPQSRERLIMIAARSGLNLPTINKTHAKGAVAGQLSLFGKSNIPWVSWYEAIKDLLPTLPKSQLTDKQKQVMDDHIGSYLIERVGYYDGEPKIIDAGNPCRTIRASLSDDGKAKNGKKGGARTRIIDVVDGVDVRSLNTQAIARLQSFPDNYRWSGNMALDVHIIGNSIPPLMMERIIKSILSVENC